jgi:hypothetical protein
VLGPACNHLVLFLVRASGFARLTASGLVFLHCDVLRFHPRAAPLAPPTTHPPPAAEVAPLPHRCPPSSQPQPPPLTTSILQQSSSEFPRRCHPKPQNPNLIGGLVATTLNNPPPGAPAAASLRPLRPRPPPPASTRTRIPSLDSDMNGVGLLGEEEDSILGRVAPSRVLMPLRDPGAL